MSFYLHLHLTELKMKMKTWVTENLHIPSSSSPGVITTISKLTKTCVLRLTPDNLFFVLSGKVANGGVGMWCELPQVELPVSPA